MAAISIGARTRLKIGDLQWVKKELWDAKPKWKALGLELLVSKNILGAIDSMQHGDPGDCLREMLAEWLRGVGEPPRTWSTIVAALKKVGGLEAIAEEIESKFNLVDKAITRDISPQARLRISDLQKVKNELWDARTKWKDIGLGLLMNPNTLDSIDSTQHGDPGNCLREMLAEWLRGKGYPPRTWSTIDAALRKVKGLEAVAEDIETKYNLVTRVTAPQAQSGSAPTFKLLTKWKVIPTVGSKWRELADLLDFDPNVTALIDEKYEGDANLACREIFMRWLKGEGSTPSWEELLEALDDGLSFTEFADELRSKLR